MRKPLVPVAIAFIAGILLNEWAPMSGAALMALALAGLVLAVGSLVTPVRDAIRLVTVLLFVGLVAANLAHLHTRCFPPNHLKRILGPDRTISKVYCRIVDHPLLRRDEPVCEWMSEQPRTDPSRTSCTVEITQISAQDATTPSRGRARLTIYEPARDLEYGDEIIVTGFLARPQGPKNPGQFDYRKYLARDNIYGVLTAPLRGNVRILKRGCGNTFWALVFGIKRRMEDFLFTHVSEPQASVLSCLLLGNRAAVPQEIEDAFQRTGTIHILSVSGLHMAMLAGVLWFALQLMGVRRKAAAVIVMVFVCYYTAMTGATAPPLRSGLMAVVMCLGVILDRRSQIMNSLGLAALVILLFDPNEVFNIGFQLSFICVFGMALFWTPIMGLLLGQPSPLDGLRVTVPRQLWFRARKTIFGGLAVSGSAQIATAPIVAYQFHYFCPLGVVHNLHILVTAWLALVIGMVLVTLGALLPAVAAPVIAFPLDAVTWVFLRHIKTASHVPFSAWFVAGPNVAWMLCYFAFLGLILWRDRLRLSLGKLIIIGLLLALVPVSAWLLTPSRNDLRLTCFAVGHGNSILLELPGNRTVLYDCGTLGNYDVGRNIVAPYLWQQGITRLDAVVLSHPHIDHVSGLPSLLDRFTVGNLVIGVGFCDVPLGAFIALSAHQERVPILAAAAGDRLTFGRTAIHVLHPPASLEAVQPLDTNDQSLLLQVECLNQRILLTGDAGQLPCRMAFSRRSPPKCDLIQIPHHGGQPRVAEFLADALRPNIALISAKKPEECLASWEMLRQRGVLPFVTARSGAIQVTLDPNHMEVHCFGDAPPPH